VQINDVCSSNPLPPSRLNLLLSFRPYAPASALELQHPSSSFGGLSSFSKRALDGALIDYSVVRRRYSGCILAFPAKCYFVFKILSRWRVITRAYSVYINEEKRQETTRTCLMDVLASDRLNTICSMYVRFRAFREHCKLYYSTNCLTACY